MPRVTHPDLTTPVMVSDDEFRQLTQMDQRWSPVGPEAAGLEGIGEEALIGGELSQQGAVSLAQPASTADAIQPGAPPPPNSVEEALARQAQEIEGTTVTVPDQEPPQEDPSLWDETKSVASAAMSGLTRGASMGLLDWAAAGDVDDAIAEDMRGAGLGGLVWWDKGQGDFARQSAEEHPIVETGAEIGAAISPGSLGARAIGGMARGARALPGKAGRAAGLLQESDAFLPMALRMGAGAGLEGAAVGGMQPVHEMYAPGGENPTLESVGEGAATGGGWGMLGGAAFAPVVKGAHAAHRALREAPGIGPELRRAEAGGMTTHPIRGIQNPPWAIRDDALAMEADELEALIEEGALQAQDTLRQMHGTQNIIYQQSPQGQALHRPGELIEAVRQKIAGKPGAFAEKPRKEWVEIREKLKDPALVYKHLTYADQLAEKGTAKSLVQAEELRLKAADVIRGNDVYVYIPGVDLPPGAVTVPADKLKAIGIDANDVDAALQRTVEESGIPEDLHHYAGLLAAKLKLRLRDKVDPYGETKMAASSDPTATVGTAGGNADVATVGPKRGNNDATRPDASTPARLSPADVRRMERNAAVKRTEAWSKKQAQRVARRGVDVRPEPYLVGKHPAELIIVPKNRPLQELEQDITDLGSRAKVAQALVEPGAQDFRDVYGVAQDLRRKYAPHPDVAPATPEINIPGAAPAGGYRGMKARHGMERRNLESAQAEVGLPETQLKAQYSEVGAPTRRIDMPTGQRQGVTAAITNFNLKDASHREAADRALEMFMEAAGGDVDRLNKLAAAVASGRLRGIKDPSFKVLANSGAAGYATNIVNAARLRFDPLARGLMAGTSPAAIGVVAGEQEDQDPLTQYLAKKLAEWRK